MSGPYRSVAPEISNKEPEWKEVSVEIKSLQDVHNTLQITKVILEKECPDTDKYGNRMASPDTLTEFRFSIKKKFYLRKDGWHEGAEKTFTVTQEELQTILTHLDSFSGLKK